MRTTLFFLLFFLSCNYSFSQTKEDEPIREHLLMDFDWRFAFGHPSDTKKDFNTSTGYFSYLAKASYGDGAAAKDFDDRSWRKTDLPHDWAVELPFDKNGSASHGFKTVGRNFPNTSVGWYRKTFTIPASDYGKRISIEFDGIYRNSVVWVNGFYLGTEASGYNSFDYNISAYLNYGGENTIAIRADATMEEGWFYEGAGIYRHVWLNKMPPVHVADNGTFVTTQLNNNNAEITTQATIINESKVPKTISVIQTIIDASNKIIAADSINNILLNVYQEKDLTTMLHVTKPHLWSVDTPYLHTLITTVFEKGKVIDRYETIFGIRTIRFDANQGFFLNGKHLELHGTNNHQDAAGIGTAMPDAMIEFRIKKLKEFGCNSYRCSHHPPTPELLNICDRLGMLVIDENRLMGVTSTHLNELKAMMLRDRNHPSVISWSIGNEEWGIEGNELGARIASTMQAYAKSIDTTRAITAAISGGWQKGISNVIDVMGVNYIGQINTDEHHKEFPNQPMWGTEEGATHTTRGIYADDSAKHYLAAYDHKPHDDFYSIEEGWKYYVARKYLAGMFIWTGFDYRGEPTPFGFPSTGAQTGVLDQCGFPKDIFYYLKSWWTDETVLHIFPDWNRKGDEGKIVDVWAYSNCDAVELFLNKKSLGKQTMPLNGHLDWKVKYQPGTLLAVGYKNGKKIATDKVETTGDAVAINFYPDKNIIKANKTDISIITVDVKDKNNLHIPIANNEINFTIEGPGKIIGVGNGDPASLEADKYIETIQTCSIENLKEKIVNSTDNIGEIAADYNDANWDNAFKDERTQAFGTSAKVIIYRGNFSLPQLSNDARVSFFYKPIGKLQSIYVNGKIIADSVRENNSNTAFVLDKLLLHEGKNSIAIIATPLLKQHSWDNINMDAGLFQIINPATAWKRKLFNGLAQVIVQSTGEAGEIILTATSENLKKQQLKIQSLAREIKTPVMDSNKPTKK
jgi:beta-galactosidase